jgi:L-lactate dehydrogenase complex protein LldE
MSINSTSKVALFGTCIIDQFFPEVGLATLRVLEKCGIKAVFPQEQTCCGQPFFNMGFRAEAREVAKHTLDVFSGYDAVVLPSGSCTSMIRVYYPELFSPVDPLRPKVISLAARTYELTQFLVRVLGVEKVDAEFNGTVTYHDGCHALRELRIREEPRKLLRGVKGCTLKEMQGCDACCGFGGTFSVKFSEISTAMVKDKVAAIQASGAETLVTTDASCLMQMSGAMSRQGVKVRPLHIAQVLASTDLSVRSVDATKLTDRSVV